jgi:hypothetical protein
VNSQRFGSDRDPVASLARLTPSRLTAWGTAVTLLWLIMIERAVHAMFVVSLAALGVSPTLLAIPLLFSGFVYPLGLRTRWPHREPFLMATTLVALASILVTIVTPGSWTVIAAAISIVALTFLLFDVTARMGSAMVWPCVLAVLLSMTLRVINGTAAPGLTRLGVVLLIVVVAAAALLYWVSRTDRSAHADASPSITGIAAIVAFLLLEYQLLASPSQLSTLHVRASLNTLAGPTPHAWWYFALLVAAQLGVLVGIRAPATDRRAIGIVALVHTASVFLLILGVGYFLAPVWVLSAQATAVYLLVSALASAPRTVGSAGAQTGWIQLVWWLLVVLHAFSTKWPFLPEVAWPLLQGRATIYLLLSFTILPALVWVDAGRRRA